MQQKISDLWGYASEGHHAGSLLNSLTRGISILEYDCMGRINMTRCSMVILTTYATACRDRTTESMHASGNLLGRSRTHRSESDVRHVHETLISSLQPGVIRST